MNDHLFVAWIMLWLLLFELGLSCNFLFGCNFSDPNTIKKENQTDNWCNRLFQLRIAFLGFVTSLVWLKSLCFDIFIFICMNIWIFNLMQYICPKLSCHSYIMIDTTLAVFSNYFFQEPCLYGRILKFYSFLHLGLIQLFLCKYSSFSSIL